MTCETCGQERRFDADTELWHNCKPTSDAIYLTKIDSVFYYGPDQEVIVLGAKDLTKS